MQASWDSESNDQYLKWITAKATTTKEKKAASNFLAILKKGILVVGPAGLTQCNKVKRKDGVLVDLYCLVQEGDVILCFAINKDQELHVVVFGKCDQKLMWDIAKQRTEAW